MDSKGELRREPGFIRDLAAFMKQNKKWWLIPVVIVTLLMGILIVLGSTAIAPFIYTVF
jgi:hypothetical protein